MLQERSMPQLNDLQRWFPCAHGERRSGAYAMGGAVVVFTLTLVLAGCSGTSAAPNPGGGSNPVVTAISMSPTAVTMNVGATTQFKATASYSDGSSKDVTSSASWTSTDPSVAPVQSSGQATPGLASGLAPGNVNITASFSGFNAVTTLNVTGTTGTLTSFFVSQIAPSIATGATLQMFGYAEYSDGSALWVTST